MKRLIIAIALLVSAAAGAKAQGLVSPFEPVTPHFTFDVRAGAGLAWMKYTKEDSMNEVTSYNASANARFYLLKGLAIESGIDVITRGGYDKKVFNNKYGSTYIEMPLLLSFSPIVSRSFRLSIDGGVYGAFGVAGKTINEVGSFPYFGSSDYAVAKPFDYGLVGGLSAEIARKVHIGLRYEYGLCNVWAGNMKTITALYDEAVIFQVGYIF